MPSPVVEKTTYRDIAAKNPNFTETDVLNAGNPSKTPSIESDVTVIGAGIHGLIYSIHAGLKPTPKPLKISVFEKSPKPLHKIGESTLPLFSLWLKNLGLTGEYLLRLFGLKDGLEFYCLDRDNDKPYTDFCTNGPPGLFLPGFQVERPISELLLTLFAQRHGIDIWHGHQADVQKTVLSAEGDVIPIKNVAAGTSLETKSPLLCDGTGRFRQIGSKFSRVKRFDGWNVDAFWGYFECHNEPALADIFRFYEAPHTNHLCFPEGWVWVIRLPSWQGSPIPNLMDMIHYILDHAEAGTPNDELPSTYELAKMFGCQVRWIFSIGYAVRNDVKYPDISDLGNTEAERRFNYFLGKYSKLKQFMSNFTLIENQYGPGTTWTIRKQLTYQTQVVSGPGWVTVGDGIGFTNPLHSPGITASMASSVYAAEISQVALSKKTEEERRELWKPYDDWCAAAIPSLNQMNVFNYVCFLDPRAAAEVSLMWQHLAGVGIPGWQLIRQAYRLNWDTYLGHSINWLWGAQVPEYELVAKKAIELLSGPPDHVPSKAAVDELIAYSDKIRDEAVASNRFNFRWDGLLRNFDILMRYDAVKNVEKDTFANKCKACGTWHSLRADWRKCYTCGVIRDAKDCEITWRPKLEREEVGQLILAADVKAIGQAADEYLSHEVEVKA
jgi:hypothetical protein